MTSRISSAIDDAIASTPTKTFLFDRLKDLQTPKTKTAEYGTPIYFFGTHGNAGSVISPSVPRSRTELDLDFGLNGSGTSLLGTNADGNGDAEKNDDKVWNIY